MSNKRFTLISILLIVVIAAFGVASVMAQDDDTTDDTTWPWGYGPGMMGRGAGMMGGGYGLMADDEPMMLTLADALGMEFEDFWLAMRSGQTLEELAAANGVELETLYATMLGEMAEDMAALVEAGTITQAQADAHLAFMQENISSMPMFGGPGMAAGTGTGVAPGLGLGPCQTGTVAPGIGMGGQMGARGRGGRGGRFNG